MTKNIFEMTGAEKHIQGIRNLVEYHKDNEALKKLLQSIEVRRDSFPPSELDNMEEFFEGAAKIAVSIAAQPKLMKVERLAEKLEALEQKFKLEPLGVVEILSVEENVKLEPIVAPTQVDVDIAEINTENLATVEVPEDSAELAFKEQGPMQQEFFDTPSAEVVDKKSRMYKAGRNVRKVINGVRNFPAAASQTAKEDFSEARKTVADVRESLSGALNAMGRGVSSLGLQPAMAGGASLEAGSSLSTNILQRIQISARGLYNTAKGRVFARDHAKILEAGFKEELVDPVAEGAPAAPVVYIPEPPFADTTSAVPEIINWEEVQPSSEFPIDELSKSAQFAPIPDDLDELDGKLTSGSKPMPQRLGYSFDLSEENYRSIPTSTPTSVRVEYDIPETEKPDDKLIKPELELSLENAAAEEYRQLWQEAHKKNLVSEGNYPSLEELQSRLKAHKREEERKELEQKLEHRRMLGHERGGRSR